MEDLRKDEDLMADKAAREAEALKILRMLNKAAAAGQTIEEFQLVLDSYVEGLLQDK